MIAISRAMKDPKIRRTKIPPKFSKPSSAAVGLLSSSYTYKNIFSRDIKRI